MKSMTAANADGFDQSVALGLAEIRHVYHCEWIARFDPNSAAGSHIRKFPARLKHRQGTIQPAKIVSLGVHFCFPDALVADDLPPGFLGGGRLLDGRCRSLG